MTQATLMLRALRSNWPEYLFEALGLAAFMLSACLITAWLEHPQSALHAALPNAALRRLLLGLGMGLTAVGIVYSPTGKRSGAHINPAVTLSFLRLGKISPWDAAFYVPSQFLGGILGVLISQALIPRWIENPAVRFAATVPGSHGVLAAFVTELVISFVLMTVVLTIGSIQPLAHFAGVATGILVALNVFFAAPLSGFGMNPARSVGSAVVADVWTSWWIYVFAPPAAMLLAADIHARLRGANAMACAKVHHSSKLECIFCGFEPKALEPRP